MKSLFKNERGTYALVNAKGKIIARFRLKGAAESMKSKYEQKLFEDLEVIQLKNTLT